MTDAEIETFVAALKQFDAEIEARMNRPPIGYALIAWYALPWWKRIFVKMPR